MYSTWFVLHAQQHSASVSVQSNNLKLKMTESNSDNPPISWNFDDDIIQNDYENFSMDWSSYDFEDRNDTNSVVWNFE